MSDGHEPDGVRRALDILVFAPLGVALTVVEDLPGFVAKGHQRVDADIRNARAVGQFVVTIGRRAITHRVGGILHAPPSGSTPPPPTARAGEVATAVAPRAPSRPDPDPADGTLVEQALAGYDTLSAAQVVRRLESLGSDELRAVHRYEASHRHRRTILNRANQLLDGV